MLLNNVFTIKLVLFRPFGLWCLMWWDVMMCDVVRMPSGPRTRPKNFFFVFSSFRLWCVIWWDVMSDVWWDAMMCDVWCGEIASFGLWCLMWWDVMMCDVVRMPSGPRTRPKNFFFVFSSFGLWCVIWWDVMSDVWWDAMMCDVWCGEISSIRPKNSAQELLFCVVFFRLVMCDVVRCDVWCLVRCNDVWCVMWWDFAYPAQALGPRTSSLCSLLSACDVWYGESAHTHRVLTRVLTHRVLTHRMVTHSAHT